MTTWTLRLPYTTPPLTLNDRHHWRTKARITRRIHADVTWALHHAHVPPCPAIHVQLVYIPRDRRTRDEDNLLSLIHI